MLSDTLKFPLCDNFSLWNRQATYQALVATALRQKLPPHPSTPVFNSSVMFTVEYCMYCVYPLHFLPLISEYACRYAFLGVILIKWIYMKCYVIICYSFESVIPFNHKFYWVPTRWPVVTPVLDIIIANIYWTFMCQALFWQFYVNYLIYSFQELCEVNVIIPFYR
jgi:hypothetical protein